MLITRHLIDAAVMPLTPPLMPPLIAMLPHLRFAMPCFTPRRRAACRWPPPPRSPPPAAATAAAAPFAHAHDITCHAEALRRDDYVYAAAAR